MDSWSLFLGFVIGWLTTCLAILVALILVSGKASKKLEEV